MAKEETTNQLSVEKLEGILSVIRLMIGVIAIRTGIAESLVGVLNNQLEASQTNSQTSPEKSGEPSRDLIEEGFDAEASRMRDFLEGLNSQFRTDDSPKATKRFVVQTSPEDLMANILVTQTALAALSSHLGLSNSLSDGLGSAKITYGPSGSADSGKVVMTEESAEIQSAINQLQQALSQVSS